MISVTFFTDRENNLSGFRSSGHSDSGSAGNDIVCAAVSSAVYLTANTITEILKVKASIQVKDGLMVFKISPADVSACAAVLKGLTLHLTALRDQYPKNIVISNTEV
jgi:uncharacterized protein